MTRLQLAIGFAALLFFLSTYHPADPDLWGHLRWGEMILQQRAIPRENTQSYTAYGTEWINYSWLSNLWMAFLWKMGGHAALIGWKVILLSATAMTLSFLLQRAPPALALILFYNFSVTLILASHFRPQLFGFFFFALLLFALSARKLKPLPLLFLLWANGHPSFAGGLACFFFWLLAQAAERQPIRESFWFLLLSAGATLMNPFGFKLWKAIVATFFSASFRQYVAEWKSPLFQPQLMLFVFPSFLIFLYLVFRHRRLSVHSLLFLPFFLLTLSSFRMLPFAAMTLLPSSLSFFKTTQGLRTGIKSLTALPLHLLFFFALFFSLPKRTYIYYSTHQMPYDAVRWIKKKKLKGNLFNEMAWGEYLIYHLGARVKVALDGRLNTAYPLETLNQLFAYAYRGRAFPWAEDTHFYLLRTGSPLTRKLEKKLSLLYKDRTATLLSTQKTAQKPEIKNKKLRILPFP